MRILTVGPSPYLLFSTSRIHKDILENFTEHHIESVVFHHDVEYFMPNEMGEHFYKNVKLKPFLGEKGELPPFLFEKMKETQPQVLLSIGSYEDTDFVWAIKSTYPNLFKWVAVILSGTPIVNEKNRLALSYADKIIVTNDYSFNSFKSINSNTEVIKYGPDKTFKDLGIERKSILNTGKNNQMSNVPAFLEAIKNSNLNATLLTNIDDKGDYDLNLLIKRHKLENNISIPNNFLSVREGLTQENMNYLYNSHSVIVDCSLQSMTALTVLEAMATGCIPVGMDFGIIGEILHKMPKEFRFIVPHETFTGPREETCAIISIKGLTHTLLNIVNMDKKQFDIAREVARGIAGIFSKDFSLAKVKETIESVINQDNVLVVDVI